MKFCNFNHFIFRTEKFRARALFLVVQNLAIDFLLGMSSVDHRVEANLPGLREVVFYHSVFVVITVQPYLCKCKTTLFLNLRTHLENYGHLGEILFQQRPRRASKPGI